VGKFQRQYFVELRSKCWSTCTCLTIYAGAATSVAAGSAKARDKDLEEGTPDHPGEPLETAECEREFSEPAFVRPGVAPAPLRQAQGQAARPKNAGTDGHMVQRQCERASWGNEFPVRSKGQPLRPTDPSAMDAARRPRAALRCKPICYL